jgi:assimilatory nitrate reductase catalytic subunit
MGKQRLYEDGIFPTTSGRARFLNTHYQPVKDAVDARYPFALNTGRLRDQWHGMSRSGTVAQLFAHVPEPGICMEATDMQRRFLKAGDLVHVTSRRGSVILPVIESDEQRAGQAFIAMHWGEEYVSGRGQSMHQGHASYGVNALTSPAIDPSSKQPELKAAAVKILKADLPWRFIVFAWLDADHAFAVQTALRPFMREFAYASCTPFGRDKVGMIFRAANEEAVATEVLEKIEKLFAIVGAEVLRYDDKRRGNSRHILVRDGGLAAVALAGDVSAEGWLNAYLQAQEPVAKLGRLLLMPSTTAPQGFAMRGKVICSCLNVADTEIHAALEQLDGSPTEVLAALQTRLKCGTNCGSCVPELKKIISLDMIQRTQHPA